jgi:hypothetical protein
MSNVEPIAPRRVRKRRAGAYREPTLAERIAVLEDHQLPDRLSALEKWAGELQNVSKLVKRWGWIILAALAGSGILTGPWGAFLNTIIERAGG